MYTLVHAGGEAGAGEFSRWLKRLGDTRTRANVLMHLERMKIGLFGDWKSLGGGLREMRLHFGKGYRIYFALEAETLVLLLAAGNKQTQKRDMQGARSRLQAWRREHGGAGSVT